MFVSAQAITAKGAHLLIGLLKTDTDRKRASDREAGNRVSVAIHPVIML